jgi:hypothetical protein
MEDPKMPPIEKPKQELSEKDLERMIESVAMKGLRESEEEGNPKQKDQVTYTNVDQETGLTVKYIITSYYDIHGDLDAMGESLTVEDGVNLVFKRTGGKVITNKQGDWIEKIKKYIEKE